MIRYKVLFRDSNFKERTGIVIDKILKFKDRNYPITQYIIETGDGELHIVTPENIKTILEKGS